MEVSSSSWRYPFVAGWSMSWESPMKVKMADDWGYSHFRTGKLHTSKISNHPSCCEKRMVSPVQMEQTIRNKGFESQTFQTSRERCWVPLAMVPTQQKYRVFPATFPHSNIIWSMHALNPSKSLQQPEMTFWSLLICSQMQPMSQSSGRVGAAKLCSRD